MITHEQLLEIGFIENPARSEDSFDQYCLRKERLFRIGEYNGQGYVIDGMDCHEPINDPKQLRALVEILFPSYYK